MAKTMRIRFRLKDLVYLTAVVALLLAWRMDRSRLNSEAASLSAELYRLKSRVHVTGTVWGGRYPPSMRSQYTKKGDVLNPSSEADRQKIAARLERGNFNFLLASPKGVPVSGVDGTWNLQTLNDD